MKTLDDFIAFYEAIPAEQWCEGWYEHNGKHCAVGFCGERLPSGDWTTCTPRVNALRAMLGQRDRIANVNDGDHPQYQQPHPKLRVLAFLNDLKAERANQP